MASEAFCVTPEQRSVHVVTEALAVFTIVPFLGWVATRDRPLNTVEQVALWAMVAGTLAVDGTLLYRWVTGKGPQ
jgi:hypothetical protein